MVRLFVCLTVSYGAETAIYKKG